MVSVFARTRSGTALLFLKCTGSAKSIHPAGWTKYSRRTRMGKHREQRTENVTFRDNMSRSVANHFHRL